MKLTEAFERIYIINLPFKADRREALGRNLLETGLIDSPADVRWFRGTVGDWCPPSAWFESGAGAWGCLRSHVNVCEDAIHDGLENYLVLEDDVVFVPHATDVLARFMAAVPADWGQIYLGGQHLRDLDRPPEIVNDQVLQPRNVNRTHAFALRSRSVMQKFCQHVQYAPDYLTFKVDDHRNVTFGGNRFHIDHQLGRAHERRDWSVYAPMWWVCGQEAGPSNISGETNPRKFWFWRGNAELLPVVVLPYDPATTPADVPHLHFGYNPLKDGCLDRGVPAATTPALVRELALTLAQEALERGQLPAVMLPPGRELDASLWPAGCLDLQASLELQHYPF